MGSLLALVSAFLFAIAAVLVRRGMQGSTAITATLISILTNLVALWVLAGASGGLGLMTLPAVATLIAAGLFAPAFARLTYYEAMNLIGVARASTISNTTPIFTALLAVPILAESISWRLAVGTVFVVIGLALTIRRDARQADSGVVGTGLLDSGVAVELVGPDRRAVVGEPAPAGPEAGAAQAALPGRSSHREAAGAPRGAVSTSGDRPWAGVLLALNTAVMASISFMLRKLGLRMLPDAAVASALTVTGSLLIFLPYAVLRSKAQPIRASRGALVLLVISAIFTTGGFLSYFYALSLSEVVRVTPLSNTTPLFALLLLALFRQERIRAATVAGAVLTVAGILFVVRG
jgi:drug/metabolite transporter (DMT)-like permease